MDSRMRSGQSLILMSLRGRQRQTYYLHAWNITSVVKSVVQVGSTWA